MVTEESIKQFSVQCSRIFEETGKDMIGQSEVVENTIVALIAGGNVLLEGVPGVGKTRLVRTLSRVFNLPFSRIQFTPDLMPADVTGTNIITKDEKGNSVFRFEPGPIFANLILADEINRATPKTQSALLEAMQEHTVTVMGVSRKMNEPFFVLATQNPIEQDGTYPLPEAQMDRFMFKLRVSYPSRGEEAAGEPHKYWFILRTPSRDYVLACNTVGQRSQWMFALKTVIKAADEKAESVLNCESK